MFGLMKNTGCLKAGEPDWYRLHYCGTCKAIGRLYGQRSRFLLNYDSVFLAEILSVIQDADTGAWDKSLYATNCFSLPDAEAIPASLQYAADMNLILVELKIRDNVQDEGPFLWKWAQHMLSKPLGKVEDRMDHWGIDTEVLLDHQAEDRDREDQEVLDKRTAALLSWHAAPSAAITAYLFAKGVEAIQQPAWKDTVYDLGYAFGELIYGLDAWKDLSKDQESGAFNPLLINASLSEDTKKQEATDWLWAKAEAIQAMMQAAAVPAEIKAALQSRLMLNLATELGESPHVCPPQSGIERATVPTVARKLNTLRQHVAAWTDPLRPARFVASYIALLLVIFQQQLSAAAGYESGAAFSLNYTLLAGLIGLPIGAYFLAKGLSKNRERILRKLDRAEKRLKRKLRRAERKARKKDGKLEWWAWALIGVGAILVLTTIVSLSLSSGNGGGCGGGGGNGCGGSGCCTCDCNTGGGGC